MRGGRAGSAQKLPGRPVVTLAGIPGLGPPGGGGSLTLLLAARSVRGVQSPEEPASQNRRLLPDSPNALHILDGPEQRYFLGLVDLATVYGLRKRLEHLWKTLRYPRRTFSTVSPARYARRLCQWVEAHTA